MSCIWVFSSVADWLGSKSWHLNIVSCVVTTLSMLKPDIAVRYYQEQIFEAGDDFHHQQPLHHCPLLSGLGCKVLFSGQHQTFLHSKKNQITDVSQLLGWSSSSSWAASCFVGTILMYCLRQATPCLFLWYSRVHVVNWREDKRQNSDIKSAVSCHQNLLSEMIFFHILLFELRMYSDQNRREAKRCYHL